MKQKFSIQSLSLRRKIFVAISLVTLIPLILLLFYPRGAHISLLIKIVSTFIIFLGWLIIFEVFSSIIKVHHQTKRTLERIGSLPSTGADEVESLESLMNILSSKVKTEFEQLNEFSHKTEELNKEVSKKVFVLSTILQANDLISKNAPAEDAVQFLMQRLKEILEAPLCCCSLKLNTNDILNTLVALGIDASAIDALLRGHYKEVFQVQHILFYDKQNSHPLLQSWASSLGLKNLALVPIIAKGYLLGIIILGNKEDAFAFSSDETAILNLISQNISIIWEHKKLLARVEELEIFDYLTGLYNAKFIFKRLDEEIKRAISYQRPCGFLLMEIGNYEQYQRELGDIEAEKLLKKVSKIFKESVRPVDIVGRTETNKLAAILIEKNKRQSQEIAKNIREKLTTMFADKITMSFAVAENPIDGTTAGEVISAAQALIGTSAADETS
ncbi:MAG: sensor domain-containing diguanylate cyclase [Candidatus Omnitrophica bacterium]|nr:sensor domain-containing diguanylate cyclase [Candidatus Omnitrophota bacterium]